MKSAASQLEAVKLIRHTVTMVCIVGSFLATAGDQPTTDTKCAVDQPANAELQLLQGTWEGALVGDEAHEKISIRVIGHSLRFHRDANFWFDTTITLPAGKDPKQLQATIKACPPAQADSIGKIVRAFFKVDGAILTLATIGDDAQETAKGFETAGTRYELRKVQEKNSEPPKTK